jgi:hypothetical protein
MNQLLLTLCVLVTLTVLGSLVRLRAATPLHAHISGMSQQWLAENRATRRS